MIPEDSMKYYKAKDDTQKAKGFSILASIFSLIIYISLFYIFNISPDTLLSNYIFWLLLSNNIILIIAVDYVVFSSYKEKQDSCEYHQYHVSSYVTTYQQVDDKKCINPEMGGEMMQEINKYMITENTEVVVQNEPNVKSDTLVPLEVDDDSDRIKRVVNDENMSAKVNEENEFNTMTNEELNRRVEEFIQKFNRQIRLQAIRDVYQIDFEQQ